MTGISRRHLFRGAAVAGAAAAAGAVPGVASAATGAGASAGAGAAGAGAAGAAAAAPGKLHRDLRDIKHIIVMMQENRSFDMYLGSLRGVIGFADKSAITLPGGNSVFQQPIAAPGSPDAGSQYPFSFMKGKVTSTPLPPSAEQQAQNAYGTDHSWDSQHEAGNGGQHNAWYSAKGIETLGFFAREDIPFHYALADAYTVGDGYHCSIMSATGPNRTFLWSGTVNADAEQGSYVAFNGGDELNQFLPWECYAESLQKAGVSWKLYQGTDNFGDNAVAYFRTFAQLDPTQTDPATGQAGVADPGNPLYDRGLTVVPEPLDYETGNGDNLANAIRADAQAGTLPEISWVVTNSLFSEHSHDAPNDGAYYVGKVLQGLAAVPEVLNSTLVVINYDENDGAFDHVPPPVPPAGTADEFYTETSLSPAAQPVGLGYRVPLFLVSPWTRGGWVTSEVSDHTSVLQLMERWTTAIGKPAICPNISEWRRAVSGDLTSALDFDHPVYGLPELPWITTTVGDAFPYEVVPATNELPEQEPGAKPARPLPYQANAVLTGFETGGDGTVSAKVALSNNAPHVARSSHFHVRNNLSAPLPFASYYPDSPDFPGQYTVAGSKKLGLSTPATINVGAPGAYDVTVVSANRFLRRFAGDLTAAGKDAAVSVAYYEGGFSQQPRLLISLANNGRQNLTFTITHQQYSAAGPASYTVRAGRSQQVVLDPLGTSHGWYDLSITLDGDASWSQRYAGHLENGKPSITGAV